jgi:hypothetical protein
VTSSLSPQKVPGPGERVRISRQGPEKMWEFFPLVHQSNYEVKKKAINCFNIFVGQTN